MLTSAFKVAFDYLASRPTDPVTINAKKFSTLEGTDPKVVIDKGKIYELS